MHRKLFQVNMEKPTSIEDLDDQIQETPRLTPRSLYACKSVGISPHELRHVPCGDYESKNIHQQLSIIRYNHNEDKRKEKRNMVLEAKQRHQRDNSQASAFSESLLKKEQHSSQLFEQHRIKEIRALLSNELQALHKESKLKQKLAQRDQKVEANRLQQARRRQELTLKRKKWASSSYLNKFQNKKNLFKRSTSKSLSKTQNQQLLQLQDRQQQEKKVFDDFCRHKEEKIAKYTKANRERARQVQERFQSNLERRELQLLTKRDQYQQKLEKIEHNRQLSRQRLQQKAEMQNSQIKIAREQSLQEMEKRRSRLFSAYQRVNKQYQDFQASKKEMENNRKQKRQERKAKHAGVRQRLSMIDQERLQKFRIAARNKASRFQDLQKKLELENLVKRELERLKQEDKREKVEREQRKFEFKQEMLKEKLLEEENRLKSYQKTSEQIQNSLQNSRQQLDSEKQSIMKLLGEIKKNGESEKSAEILKKVLTLSSIGPYLDQINEQAAHIQNDYEKKIKIQEQLEARAEEERLTLLETVSDSHREALGKVFHAERAQSRDRIKRLKWKMDKDLSMFRWSVLN